MPNYIQKRIRVFTGKVIRVDQLNMDFGKSGQHPYEIVSFNVVTGVSALPLIDPHHLILLRHYQAGIDEVGWSLPTGGLHQGEDPVVRMQAELQEELGYKAGSLTLMARFHPLPGYIGTQAGYLYLAQDLTPSVLKGDEPYPIEVHKLDLNRVLSMIQAGEINDTRTALAILYYVQYYGRSQ